MVSAKEYLKELSEIAYSSKNSWRITTEAIFDGDYEKKQLETSLLSLNDPAAFEDYKNGKFDNLIKENTNNRFDQSISKLAPSLLEDINICTQGKYQDLLKDTYLSFIPLNKFSAFTTSKTLFLKEPLDGCIICINQGLFLCVRLIAKAFLFENLQGEFSSYQRSGISEYKHAINLYFTPNKKDLAALFFDSTKFNSAEDDGVISAIYSSIFTMILQFVALHEFGHIVHKDVYSAKLNRLHFADVEGKIKTEKPIEEVEKFWKEEYAADSFAIKAISSRAKTTEAAWANFLAIYLFFKWINDLEVIKGKELCPLHPPPLDRIKNLISIMHKKYGVNSEAEEMMDRIDLWTKKWLQDF